MLIIHSYFRVNPSAHSRVKVQCLPWRDTSWTPNEVRSHRYRSLFAPTVCRLKFLPTSLPSLSRHSTPHHTSQEFLFPYFPAPRQSTIQARRWGKFFRLNNEEASMWASNFELERVRESRLMTRTVSRVTHVSGPNFLPDQ